ncbi:glutamate racemase [Oceanisphaera arctica]|uniref:Glutamate racemase n=1 Tax=Oceanisphaera arctica TaxID=641510 RepID=A0A2P5TIZ3_9GAMM|nr:glutamate racemase [Oceanisphaera arctica]PPL14849.1 glutamate racemase [Oceanisphaera arctica]GHA13196.1 glutamate racemase [Oceanisphaera arctica]
MANILIFDSGMGGLSVYREVSKTLTGHQYLYLFDNACFPYGELSESRLVERVVELFEAFVARYPVDIAIIACNTASTNVLPALRQRLSIPVVGVVPAIKPAAEYSRLLHQTNSLASKPGHIGLLATPGTVSRRYTAELIQSFAADLQVSLLGTTELVKMAEDKLWGQPVDMHRLGQILAPWRGTQGPDTIVLGCTHFPLLADELSLCLPQVKLIDSGEAIARRVASLLLLTTPSQSEHPANIGPGQLFCTQLTKKARLQAGTFGKEGFGTLGCFTP